VVEARPIFPTGGENRACRTQLRLLVTDFGSNAFLLASLMVVIGLVGLVYIRPANAGEPT
jgi:hypothetical protein